jgi:hypothetical protein
LRRVAKVKKKGKNGYSHCSGCILEGCPKLKRKEKMDTLIVLVALLIILKLVSKSEK